MLQNIGLFILRVFVAIFLLIGHGWPKLMQYSQVSLTFPDPIGVGKSVSLILVILAEVGCSLLLILGLFTRIAAGALFINMVVAIVVVHAMDPWQQKELPLLYALFFLVLMLTGAGSYSLDSKKGLL